MYLMEFSSSKHELNKGKSKKKSTRVVSGIRFPSEENQLAVF